MPSCAIAETLFLQMKAETFKYFHYSINLTGKFKFDGNYVL